GGRGTARGLESVNNTRSGVEPGGNKLPGPVIGGRVPVAHNVGPYPLDPRRVTGRQDGDTHPLARSDAPNCRGFLQEGQVGARSVRRCLGVPILRPGAAPHLTGENASKEHPAANYGPARACLKLRVRDEVPPERLLWLIERKVSHHATSSTIVRVIAERFVISAVSFRVVVNTYDPITVGRTYDRSATSVPSDCFSVSVRRIGGDGFDATPRTVSVTAAPP